MRCLYGHSDLVADFVGKMLGAERGFGPCRATGVIDASGRLVAGVVYNDWDDKAGVIQMSAASINPKWLTRRILCELMAYPFFQLGCQMVVFRTQPENRRTRKLVTGMGAVEYEIPRLGGRDKSEVLMCLTDDAWIASPYMKRSNVLPASGADIVDGRRLDPVSGGDADDGLASLPAAANVKDRGGVKPGASVGLALAGLCLVVVNEVRAEHAHRITRFCAIIAPKFVRVRGAEFTLHFPNQV